MKNLGDVMKSTKQMNMQLSRLVRSVKAKNYSFTEKGQIKNKISKDEISKLLAEDISEEYILESESSKWLGK